MWVLVDVVLVVLVTVADYAAPHAILFVLFSRIRVGGRSYLQEHLPTGRTMTIQCVRHAPLQTVLRVHLPRRVRCATMPPANTHSITRVCRCVLAACMVAGVSAKPATLHAHRVRWTPTGWCFVSHVLMVRCAACVMGHVNMFTRVSCERRGLI